MRWAGAKSKISAIRHKSYVRLLSSIAPYYVVNEFPKSGGTWLAEMLADALGLPFRRNRPIRFEPSIAHGHLLYPFGLRNVVTLWRDPRDIVVSLYYHCYFLIEPGNVRTKALMKQRLPFDDYSDIRANLPDFIRFVSTTPLTPRFTWSEFARRWAGRQGVVHTTYEALRRDTPGVLSEVVASLSGRSLEPDVAAAIAADHSFEKDQAKVQREGLSAEHLFVREGSVGGWRRHFTQEAEQEMLQRHGPMMAVLGFV